MTSFYSWRLIFMTFHGMRAGDAPPITSDAHEDQRACIMTSHGHDHDHAAREPVRDAGAAGAAGAWRGCRRLCLRSTTSSARATRSSGAGSLFEGAHNHILHAMHEIPGWVGWAPFAGHAGRLRARLPLSTSPCRRCRPRPRAAFRPLYLFLLNKWYFDELYDCLFVRPAFWLGRLFWKNGDGTIIDGLGPDGIAARVLWTTGRVVQLQTGYVYHYAFAMLIGVAAHRHLVHVRGGAVADERRHCAHPFARHVPAAGRRAAHRARRTQRGRRRNARWIALCTTLVTFAVSLLIWVQLRPGATRLPVRRGDGLARRLHPLQAGRRRHLDAVRAAHRRS